MRYLTQRSSSGIWYFRYQIPARFRSFFPYGREIKKSLSTRSLTTAKLRASRLQQVVWERMELLEKHSNDGRKMRSAMLNHSSLDDAYISKYLNTIKRQTLSKLTTYIQLLERKPNLLRAQRQRIELRKKDSDTPSIEIIESIYPRDANPVEVAEEMVSLDDHAFDLDTLHYREDKKNIHIAMGQFYRDYQRCLDSLNLEGARAVLKEIEEYESGTSLPLPEGFKTDDYWGCTDLISEKLSTLETQVVSSVEPREIVDIEKVLEGYVLEKTNEKRGKKEVKAVVAACRLVHDLLGSSDMSRVSRDDVNLIIPKIKLFPKNARGTANKKHFDGLSASAILKKNEKLGLELREEDQALRDIERTSTLYKWAKRHKKITYNPFEGLSKSKSSDNSGLTVEDVETDKDKKDPFTLKDLKEIYSHPVYTKGQIGWNVREKLRLNYQYWIMMIVMLTGARPNEICQLRIKDVKPKHGVMCFWIQAEDADQRLKNKSAIRLIPIPDALFTLGFQSYLDSVSDGRMLFPDLTYTEDSGYYGKVEDWFDNHFSVPMELKDQNKSLYSLRHTFIKYYQDRGTNCMVLKQLIGHKNGNITDDTYGGRASVEQLKAKIEEFDVSEVLKGVLPFKVASY